MPINFKHNDYIQGVGDALTMPGGIAERAGERPRLPQVAVQLVLVRVADGAMALQRLATGERRRVGCHRLCHRDVEGGAAARIHPDGYAWPPHDAVADVER